MQSQFKAALLSEDSQIYSKIDAPTMAEKEVRLNVYRNNVVVSLVEALADIFPVTQTLVGEAFFKAMAREYVLTNPPQSPIISQYGDTFSDFIYQFEAVKSLPFLANLAALEYSLLDLTNSEEYHILNQQAVSEALEQAESPNRLLISLPPSSKIFVSPYAIGSIYKAHLNDDNNQLSNIKVDNSEHLLLVKSHVYAQLHIISHAEAVFIKNLLLGCELGEAIPEDNNFDLGQSLAQLIAWQVITQIAEPSTN
ncbi:HvfC/BufC family peptide modification chaperone [Marinomonas epiphytica]